MGATLIMYFGSATAGISAYPRQHRQIDGKQPVRIELERIRHHERNQIVHLVFLVSLPFLM